MEVPTGTSFFILLYSAVYKNKFVGAGFHPRPFIYKQQPRRGRPPGRPGCTDHNPVILRALPEESLLYNYRKIIFSATY